MSGFEVAALIATAVGTGVSVYSAEQSASYQASVARHNAQIASYNAVLAQQQGEQQAQAKQRDTAAMVGAQRAAASASGVELDSGSPLRVQSDTAKLGALDVATIRNNAAREAWNARLQQASFGAEASQAQTAGDLNAFASLAGGASSFAGKWSQFRSGGWDPYSSAGSGGGGGGGSSLWMG